MIVLRSLVFNLYYIVWTLVIGALLTPLLIGPRKLLMPFIRFWLRGFIGGARILVGINWRVEGRENLPKGACIIACKHQSAWETLFLHLLLDDPAYVLKKELLRLPLVGWQMKKAGSIAIDRKAGMGALRQVLRKAEPVLREGRQIIIFPEGTRVPPLAEAAWQPGVGALYTRFSSPDSEIKAPVVPIALNSGVFWGRNAFIKRPGTVILRIMPPMPEGLDKKAFLKELRTRIDGTSRELCIQAGAVPPAEPAADAGTS